MNISIHAIEDNEYQTVSGRYAREQAMLYTHSTPVTINRTGDLRGYLGTDIMGSTRSEQTATGCRKVTTTTGMAIGSAFTADGIQLLQVRCKKKRKKCSIYNVTCYNC